MSNKTKIHTTFTQVSLIEAVDDLDTLHQQTGEANNKILLIINNMKGEGHKLSGGAPIYIDREDFKMLAFDIMHGYFKTQMYPQGKKPGEYVKYGGGQFARILNIKFENGSYVFEGVISEATKGYNGTVKPGKLVDSHAIKLTEYQARRFFKICHDYIDHKELLMRLPLFTSGQVTSPSTPISNEPIDEDDTIEVDDNFFDGIFEMDGQEPSGQNGFEDAFPTGDDLFNDPPLADDNTSVYNEVIKMFKPAPSDLIIPSGKNQGKKLSEVPDSFKKWAISNVKPTTQWQPVLDAMKQELGV